MKSGKKKMKSTAQEPPLKRARGGTLPKPTLASGQFMPTSFTGDERARRHAQGNWPAFVHIQLPGLREAPASPAAPPLQGLVAYGDDSDSEGEQELDDAAATLASLARAACDEAAAHAPPGVPMKRYVPSEPNAAQGRESGKDGPLVCEQGGDVAPGDRASHADPQAAGSLRRRSNWAHVSLAKPFALRKHEIEPLLAALAAAVGLVPAFDIVVGKAWGLLPSDPTSDGGGGGGSSSSRRGEARTPAPRPPPGHSPPPLGARCFVYLDVVAGREGLGQLVSAADGALARFGKPPYFTPALLHVTVAEVAAGHGAAALAPLRAAAAFSGQRLGAGSSSGCSSGGRGGNGDDGADSGGGNGSGGRNDASDRERTADGDVAVFRVTEIELKAGHHRFPVKLGARGY